MSGRLRVDGRNPPAWVGDQPTEARPATFASCPPGDQSTLGLQEFRRPACGCGLSRMNAHEQLVEGQVSVRKNDNLAIEYESWCGQLAERSNQFGKVAAERLPGFGLQQNLICAAECEAAEAGPLGLIEPAGTRGDFRDGFGLHGRIRRFDWKVDIWEIGFQSFFWKSAGTDPVAAFVVCEFLSGHIHWM